MIAIIGLGNYKAEYNNTRHNMGFMFVDRCVTHKNLSYKTHKGCDIAILDDVMFVKPKGFMNQSGQNISALYTHYKPTSMLVVHDDVDLAQGVIKTKFAGGHGGHNGLRNIDYAIHNQYWRLRIGIGRDNGDLSNYVLGPLSLMEKNIYEDIFDKLLQKIDTIISGLQANNLLL